MSAWWRRNRLALAALFVLIPSVGLLVWWDGWYSFYGYGALPTTAITVDSGDTAKMSGTVFGPINGGEVTQTEGLDLPPNTRFYATAIPIDPQEFLDPKAEEPVMASCSTPVLIEQSTGREWSPVREEVGIGYSADEPGTCSSVPEGPYQLVVGFVVPDDVTGPFWVDIDPVGDDSLLRFTFEP